MKLRLITALGIFLTLTTTGVAQGGVPLTLRDIPWGEFRTEYLEAKKMLKGTWRDEHQWKGYFCKGSYSYQVRLQGFVQDIQFDLNDHGTVDVRAEIRRIYSRADGSYRSDKTLCVPFRGWLGASADDAIIRAEVEFIGETLTDIKLRVKSTRLGTIHMGEFVPGWMEKLTTGQVNRGLQWVWSSQVGEWLSDRIAAYVKDKFPDPTGMKK